MTARILFVEDEDGLRNVLLEAASLDGHQAEGVATAEAALERFCAAAELPPKKIEDEARSALKSYHWPVTGRAMSANCRTRWNAPPR